MGNFSRSLFLGLGLTGLGFTGLGLAAADKVEKKAGENESVTGTTTAANQVGEMEEAASNYPQMPTECKAGEAYRKVWIEYGNAQGQKCKVNYIKDQQPAKILWTAENDPDFCVTKAKGLINETLAGFNCTEVR